MSKIQDCCTLINTACALIATLATLYTLLNTSIPEKVFEALDADANKAKMDIKFTQEKNIQLEERNRLLQIEQIKQTAIINSQRKDIENQTSIKISLKKETEELVKHVEKAKEIIKEYTWKDFTAVIRIELAYDINLLRKISAYRKYIEFKEKEAKLKEQGLSFREQQKNLESSEKELQFIYVLTIVQPYDQEGFKEKWYENIAEASSFPDISLGLKLDEIKSNYQNHLSKYENEIFEGIYNEFKNQNQWLLSQDYRMNIKETDTEQKIIYVSGTAVKNLEKLEKQMTKYGNKWKTSSKKIIEWGQQPFPPFKLK